MCLDLQLLVLSEGKYGIQRLMQDLSTKYGIEKPFKDKRLFKDIGKLSGYKKEMKNFFKQYVEGAEKLPIETLVKAAGVTYKEKGIVKELSPFGFNPNKKGGISFDFTEKKLVLLEPGIDAFGRSIGFEVGDLLLMWNDEKLTMENIQAVLSKHAMAAKSEGYEFTVSVLRKDEKGDLRPKRFEVVLKKVEVEVSNAFVLDENPTAAQLAIRKAWLGTEK
jgi:predicted metalloprotease with PDZ domain